MTRVPPPFLDPEPVGLMAELAVAATEPSARSRLKAWSVLAVAALAVAGVFALLLAASRLPRSEALFPWPVDFFHKSLVIHVVFSFVVWFLAAFGALLELASLRLSGGRPRGHRLADLAWLGTAASFPLLFVPALMDRGEATLNNYVPAIVDPIYYAGLVALGGGIAAAVVRLLVNLPGRRAKVDPFTGLMVAAGITYLVSLVCFGLSLAALEGEPLGFGFNEDLFWSGGHLLQFVNVAMLVAGWWVLGWAIIGRPIMDGRSFLIATAGVIALAAVAALALALTLPAFSDEQRLAFTNLQYLHLLPTILAGGAAAIAVRAWPGKGESLRWHDPAFVCLTLSIVVFGVGGILGLFVDGQDTRTPAHYHGVIAGITTVIMGLFHFLLLPVQRRPVRHGRTLLAQLYLFPLGQSFASLGLFLAGGHGAARKTAGAAQGLKDMDLAATVGMAMNGLGGLVAVIGGIMFVVAMVRALTREPVE